jgi:flagellar hook assembly protein FlgD
VLGQEVRTLINEYKHSGEHSIKWDGLTDNGIQAASGLYLYKLKSNGTQISKSMSLIR